MSARTFLTSTLPAALAAAPDAFRLHAVYVFRLSGNEGGEWTLDLAGDVPVCRSGAAERFDCEIECSAEDFAALTTDPDRARELFYRNQIRVRGNLMLASQLPKILLLAPAPAAAGGLAALIAPVAPAEFLRERWPDRHLALHGDPARLAPLSSIEALAGVDAMLAAWPGMVRASEEIGGALVPPEEAGRLHATGVALSFASAEQALPLARLWLTRLQWDLGLPANVLARCIVYATPRGAGAAFHFDHNANFVVQLSGRKVWELAPNTSVVHPTERFTAAVPDITPELRLYSPPSLPTDFPTSPERVVLTAGSVLFLPRGYWHRTHAEEDSLSLNFTFSQPTWADVVLPELRRRLVSHPHWRELADGAGAADGGRRDAARRRLAALLAGLMEDVGRLDAERMIAALTPSEAEAPPVSAKRRDS